MLIKRNYLIKNVFKYLAEGAVSVIVYFWYRDVFESERHVSVGSVEIALP